MPRRTKVSALEGYVFHLRAQNLAAHTIKNYVLSARLWLKHCESIDLDPNKATEYQLSDWLTHLAMTQAPSTVRLRTISIRVYYDYLRKAGLVKRNPAREIKIRKQVSRPVGMLEPAEVKALINASETLEDRAMMLLMVGGGLRRSELMSITRADVNYDQGEIRIWGKGRKWRVISPGIAAMEAVRMALQWRERLFSHTNSDWVRRRLTYLAKKAEINRRVHPHMLHYYFAVDFCEAGGSIDHLQEILGHTSLTMAMMYSRAGRDRRARAAQIRFNPADRLMA